jgi:hypothetical protein
MNHSRLNDAMSATQWSRDHLDFVLSLAFVEWLPGSVLLIPASIAIARKTVDRERDLMLAAVLYAVTATMVLLVWPGGVASRYAMPANLALAVLGGILFDRWWTVRPWLVAIGNTVVIGLSGALIFLGWIVMPLAPDTFRQSAISAQSIAAVRAMVPGTVYFTKPAVNYNVLAYVPAPVRGEEPRGLLFLKAPALAILTDSEITALMADYPRLGVIPHAIVGRKPVTKIVEIRPN